MIIAPSVRLCKFGRLVLLIGFTVALAASTASAQTHACDQAVPTTGTVASTTPLYAEFCQQLTTNIDAVTVYRNGTPTNLTALELRTTTANAAGLVQYRVLVGPLPIGKHTIEVSNWNKTLAGVAQEGPRSLPFTLTVASPIAAPTAPTRLHVRP